MPNDKFVDRMRGFHRGQRVVVRETIIDPARAGRITSLYMYHGYHPHARVRTDDGKLVTCPLDRLRPGEASPEPIREMRPSGGPFAPFGGPGA